MSLNSTFATIEKIARSGRKMTDHRAPLDPEQRYLAEKAMGEIIRKAANELAEAPFHSTFPAGDTEAA